MKSSTIYKFILVTLLLASVIGLTFFTVKTMREKVESIKVQSLKDNKNKNLEFGNDLRNSMSTLLAQETVIKSSFIPADNVLEFIQSLEDNARTLGLQITIDNVDKKKDVPLSALGISLADSEFSIQIKGPYNQVLLFLNNLIKNDKKLSLNQVNMYRNENDGVVEFTAQIKVTGIMLSYE